MKRNFFDSLISAINPTAGLRRMRARYAEEMLVEHARKYEAAATGRRTAGWRATGADVNAEIAGSGSILRNRSRDMVRNNPFARRAAKVIPANVVGKGIRPSISSSKKRNVARLKELWKDWAESNQCDFEERKNFYAIQRLVMRSVVESGECFIRRTIVPGLTVPLQLQVLEADFLDSAKDGIETDGGGYIENGIEFNAIGKRVAYWFFAQHPGSNRIWKRLESIRIPASEIIHVFYEERPGQLRGVPFGTASMLRLRDFDEYEDAQLIRQKIAACFSVFISSTDDPAPGDKNKISDIPLEKVEPGIIEYLPPGKEVSFGNPPPVEGYDTYSNKMLQGVAAGYDLTYEALTNDLSNVNFSSGRMGWIEFGKLVSEWQSEMIVGLLCEGVWKWFTQTIQIAGLANVEGAKVEWTVPRREMIDPTKETKGLSDLVRNGFESRQNVIRQLGGDPEIVMAQILEDNAIADGGGLKLVSDARHDKPEPKIPDKTDGAKKEAGNPKKKT